VTETANATPFDVSVVIPTRGRPELLKRAIRSVLQQTAGNLEVIVVLDGVDDDTQAAVEGFNDERVRLVALGTPVGGSEARNVGARAASGRYVALLDDDDEWLPEKLGKQLMLADSCGVPDFVVVTEYLYRVEGRGDEVWPGHLPGKGEPLSEFLFSSRGGFQTSTYLCPRELFLRMPFTLGLKKHQDWDWFLRLAALPGFQLLVVPEPLSVYWAPLSTRSSVSGKMDWEFSQTWAKSKLSLMTRKAYAMFLVKISVRGAVGQKEGMRVMLYLLREVIFVAKPSPLILAEFAAAVFMPEGLRLRLRRGLVWLRSRPHSPVGTRLSGPEAPVTR
jgi:glycosyltransferase involved in cell wall biosynthesis